MLNMLRKMQITIFILVVIPCTVLANETLTPKEIVELVQASKGLYNSFEIEMKEITYKCKNWKPQNEPDQEIEILWRSTGTRVYSEIKKKIYDYSNKNSKIKEFRKTYAITPEWSKKLSERSKSIPRGIVKSGDSYKGELGTTVVDAIWNIFGQRWEKLTSDNASLIKDEKDDRYILSGPISSDGTTISVVIDPKMNFIPIKYEIRKPNGELLIKCECSDFRKMSNDLWLPYQYDFATESYLNVHKIKEAKINIPLSEELLNFSFPSGTIVSDRIANLKYVVDTPQTDENVFGFGIPDITLTENINTNALKPAKVTINDIKNPGHAEENKLLDAKQIGQELILKEKENQTFIKSEKSKYAKLKSWKVIVFIPIIIIAFVMFFWIRWRVSLKRQNLK